ncbi:MAG: branched-chain amino acid transport system ATP-binding protein [Acetobacteraceae bacterium]|jgi:branched-chain amino acid transport system ATP-binding protein|nr:branched-chain amino acid transport system ATP-binding protein [Acetobacteraceae bacterium]
MLLEVSAIAVAYGTAQVLHGLSLHVETGETITLIGANGAGKTSCLRAISGLEPLTAGSIRFEGKPIDTLSPRQRLERGLVHVPEGKRLFPRMTVRENLAMGAFLRRDSAAIRSDIDAMYARFPILKARQGQHAGSLSGGEQQILAFARGLMARPKLLLVDEPTVGLSPLMVKELSAALRAIHADGVAILLVEQNAAMALRLASRGYLLETGSCVAEDETRALMANDYVRKAYLGI